MQPPPFPLQTGFSNVVEPALNAQQKETLEKLLLVFVKQAFGHAADYANAANRTMVLTRDLTLGLKVAALPTNSYSFWEQDIHAELEEMEAILNESHDDEEEEDESFVADVEEVWTEADSNHSDIVRRMNSVEVLWDQWEPTDIMGRAIKNAVLSM
jgi:hypothetical protein